MNWIHAHAVWIVAGLLFALAGWFFYSGCKDLREDAAEEEGESERVTEEIKKDG